MLGSGCTSTSDTSEEPSQQASAQPVTFIGFDADPSLIEALNQKKLQGLVVQDPFNMGYLGVQSIVVHLENGEVKSFIGTGEKMVTPENLSDPKIEQLLNPSAPPKGSDPKAQEANKEDTKAEGKESEGNETPGTKGKKTWRVLVIPKATGNEFWQAVHAGALKAAEELGNVEILWEGPEKEDDYTKQIDLIEGAKGRGVNGVVLAPLDAKLLASPAEHAIDQGVPVVVIDSNLESDKTVSFVGTDNYHGGVLAAKRVAELLGGKGNVILLRHMVGSGSTEQRENGFLEAISRYPEIKVLSQDQYAGATVDSAEHMAQALLKTYKNRVNGIFCSNEQSTLGMLKALQEEKMAR